MSRGGATRDELAIKLSLAATLPGADVSALIDVQRAAGEAHLEQMRELRRSREDESAEGLAWSLVVDSMVFAAEAEQRWLDHVRTRLVRHPQHTLALELTTDRPKRGRPARSGAVALA